MERAVQGSWLQGQRPALTSLYLYPLLPPGRCCTLPRALMTGDLRMQRRCLRRVLYRGYAHTRHRRIKSLAQRIQEWMNPSKCLPLSPNTLRDCPASSGQPCMHKVGRGQDPPWRTNSFDGQVQTPLQAHSPIPLKDAPTLSQGYEL